LPIGEGADAVPTVDESSMLQITQNQSNGHPADAESLAKLMFALDGKVVGFGVVKNCTR
jgi:hypothetical protein